MDTFYSLGIDQFADQNYLMVLFILRKSIDRQTSGQSKVENVSTFSIDQQILIDCQISLYFNRSACPNWKISHKTGFPIMGRLVEGAIWATWPETAWKLQNQHFWGKTMGDMRGDKPIFRAVVDFTWGNSAKLWSFAWNDWIWDPMISAQLRMFIKKCPFAFRHGDLF